MKIVWNRVTHFSQLVAILIALLIFIGGLYLGRVYQALQDNVPSIASTPATVANIGTVTGAVSVAPLCPVQSNSPKAECPNVAIAPNSLTLTFSQNGQTVKQLTLSPKATFTTTLPAGTYSISTNQKIGSIQPSEVTVQAGQTTTLNLQVDSGIR